MKRLTVSVMIGLFCALTPGRPALASTWSRFAAVESRYYRLDQQPISTIFCRILVPTLTNEVGSLNERLAGMVSVTDSLKSYRLVFRKSSGLKIDDPVFQFHVVDGTKVTNPARLALGEKQLHDGLERQVNGVDHMISALFDDYETPTPRTYKVKSVRKHGNSFILSYRHDGSGVVEVISGDNIKNETHHGKANITAHSHYEKSKTDKLIFHSAVMNSVSADMKLDSSIKVTYQKFDGIEFPAQMATIDAISRQGQTKRMQINIRFTHCREK